MGRCKDCKHWTPYEYKLPFGKCDKPGDADYPKALDKTLIWSPYGEGGDLLTRPDFGCVSFEGK